MNVAYIICALNIGLMVAAEGDVARGFYFLIANLWLMLGVYLAHKK
ncbi:MAG: hypothetical protein K2P83_08830 [Nitrosomonas sp.]|nr:hypothetical protein [Nitrosomonas sp.]